jgi:predicted DNA-binding ribbon-helix-helix protein
MNQLKHTKKTVVIKRSIFINGEFWDGLREIAGRGTRAVALLVEQINRDRDNCNLSSAIRIFVFNHFRAREKIKSTASFITVSGQEWFDLPRMFNCRVGAYFYAGM